jgi:hypothetical protein
MKPLSPLNMFFPLLKCSAAAAASLSPVCLFFCRFDGSSPHVPPHMVWWSSTFTGFPSPVVTTTHPPAAFIHQFIVDWHFLLLLLLLLICHSTSTLVNPPVPQFPYSSQPSEFIGGRIGFYFLNRQK